VSLIETETIFGRIVSANDVEQAVLATLKKWSSTYIAELERQHGYTAGELQRVRGWVLAPTFDKWPEDQLPGVLVVSPGLIPPPMRDGDGTYRATWSVDVGCCCSARDQQRSHELAQMFVAAHKAIVLQRPSLGGFATACKWMNESYDALAYDDTRSLYAGYATFAIEVANVVTTLAGPTSTDDPLTPDTDPWADWPEVETVDVDVEHVDTITPSETEDGS
jgi:hypothetical protein